MIQRLAEHSVRVDLLPESPTVLDVGARGFDFTRAILTARPKARVLALDPSPDVDDPGIPNCELLHRALIGGGAFVAVLSVDAGHPAGNHLGEGRPDPGSVIVQSWCIDELMIEQGVLHWDLVKLDCEGSEFEILRNWPGPIASQISVEFHDALPRCAGESVAAVLEHLVRLGYLVVQHEASEQAPGVGHWDSLFVLRSLL